MKFQYQRNNTVECIHVASGTCITADAPKDIGGQGSAFSPTDLVGVALASCILITMGLAAKKMGISIEGAVANVEKEMSSAPTRRIGKLVVHLQFPQAFSLDVQKKLEEIAIKCPVHASLHPDVRQEIHFSWNI